MRSVARSSHNVGVHDRTALVQDIGPGEIATASCCDRGQVRMWRPLGRVREAQGCMPTFREVCGRGPWDQRRTLAQICRELVRRFELNTKLRDMNVAVEANDERAIEVLATGLPLHQGVQLAVDITLRSALTTTGLATLGAAHIDGIVLQRARADKERKYAELLPTARRCQLVVVGLETGGRWSSEAVDFVSQLAGHKAREVSPILRGSAFFAWLRKVAEDAFRVMREGLRVFVGALTI